jgi:hypothetical protein
MKPHSQDSIEFHCRICASPHSGLQWLDDYGIHHHWHTLAYTAIFIEIFLCG